MELFDHHRESQIAAEAPLAARMRPRTLDEFVGQEAIVGQGRLLRRAIQADQLSSLIFYGPPGTGKTTLAQIIANSTKGHFIAINAVLSGVQAIRDAIATAQEKRGLYNQRTILFVDEVHRFNKSQQDALLPWVENGTVILIGATTENPYFEVNKALVSRSRLFQLKPLESKDLKQLVTQTLSDPDRGYGNRKVELATDALDHLTNVANGDARTLLNALELAVSTTPINDAGITYISLSIAEESIQRRAVLYDKEGDAHFDTISAFIKSLRGSDPDAALYWLARMVYAGEDPRFVFRRMLIFAGEDVGMADPTAITVVNACAQAFDRIGLPEGRYPLAQAALYLATCPKSNSIMGFFDALTAIEKEREAEVPNPLRDNSRDSQGFGHGTGYLYPHAYNDHWVAQQYLPTGFQGRIFYQPSEQGYEKTIAHTVARHREAQLTAMLEGILIESLEGLTHSPKDSRLDQWLDRSLSQTGETLGKVRDRLFEIAKPQRHHLILNLNAATGLILWEAIRQVPEGGVYAQVIRDEDYRSLLTQSQSLPELSRPHLTTSGIPSSAPPPKFDRILARNLFLACDRLALIRFMAQNLAPTGRIHLAESIPHHAQRLYSLIQNSTQTPIDPKLLKRWKTAEEKLYNDSKNPKTNWTEHTLLQELTAIGLTATVEVSRPITQTYFSPALFNRWFAPDSNYFQTLNLPEADRTQIQTLATQHLLKKTLNWETPVFYITASYSSEPPSSHHSPHH